MAKTANEVYMKCMNILWGISRMTPIYICRLRDAFCKCNVDAYYYIVLMIMKIYALKHKNSNR